MTAEDPETFRASLLHVINPFRKEDEDIFSDDSSLDSDVSSAGIDSEFIASFDESRNSAEEEGFVDDAPPRDPFAAYNSFESRHGSEDSIERDDFPPFDESGPKGSWISIGRKSSSLRNSRSVAEISHSSSKATVNISNVTTNLTADVRQN